MKRPSFLRSRTSAAVAGAIVVVALGGTGAVAATVITGANIKDGTVAGIDIKNGSLTGADVYDGSISRNDIKDGTLTGADIYNGGLTGADVADGSITGADLSGITASDFAAGGVSGADLLNGTVTSADIADQSIEAGDLAPTVGDSIAQQIKSGSYFQEGQIAGTWTESGLTGHLPASMVYIDAIAPKGGQPVQVTIYSTYPSKAVVARCVAVPTVDFDGTCSSARKLAGMLEIEVLGQGGDVQINAVRAS